MYHTKFFLRRVLHVYIYPLVTFVVGSFHYHYYHRLPPATQQTNIDQTTRNTIATDKQKATMSSNADSFSPLSSVLSRARTRTNTGLSQKSSSTARTDSTTHHSSSKQHLQQQPSVDPALLPKSTSPTLRLVQCTPAEAMRQQGNNAAAWRGSLSLEQYLRRESILANQDLTREGGMTFWMLADDGLPRVGEHEGGGGHQHQHQQQQQYPWHGGGGGGGEQQRRMRDAERVVLSGCESFRKRAFLRRKSDESGRVREVVCHGVGSVFCPEEFRKRGYAGVMMRKLADQLAHHQSRMRDGRPLDVSFSVLYSDIGREFYNQNGGWEPFESTHISLPAVPPSSEIIENANASFPLTRRLKTEDLPSLCLADETLLRKSMERMKNLDKDVVAIVPDVQTIMWMHAREDFICQEIFTRYPEIKGAIVGMGEGKHAWCYWVRMYYNDEVGNSEGNNLYVMRIAIEPGLEGTMEGEVACAALLQAAQREAHGWHMQDVVVWNPTEMIQRAAARALGKKPGEVKVEEREKESICMLRWYGDGGKAGTARDSVQWVANDKFAWC